MRFDCSYLFMSGDTHWRSWSRHCTTIQKVTGLIPYSVTGIFIDIVLPAGPGINSASNRIEYQEYFLGGKGGRCVGLTTLPPSCANCFEICIPQPPGALKACTGIALLCLSSVLLCLQFSTLLKELKELSEPLRKSAQSRATNSSQRRTTAKQWHSYSDISPTVHRRRSVRIRRSTRLKE